MKDIKIPETIEPTKTLIEEIIKNNTSEKLLLLEETAWLEFHYNYDISSPEPGGSIAKNALAIDCSSMANSGGGYIITGVHTDNIVSKMTDYVDKIDGINKSKINLTGWKNYLSTKLTPRFTIEDMKYGYLDAPDNKFILYLKIPSAKELGIYPIIVQNDQWQIDKTHRVRGKVVGIYERYGPENQLLQSEVIQTILSKAESVTNGELTDPQQVKRIEIKLDRLLSKTTSHDLPIDPDKMSKKFINIAHSKIGEDNEGFFYIYAAPKDEVKIDNFWEPITTIGSVPYLMKNPPTLRRMGWDLSVAIQEQPTAEPNMWEIKNGNRKMVDVTESAELFAAGTLSRFLSWGVDDDEHQQPGFNILINEYALTEFIGMYFALLQSLQSKINSDKSIRYDIIYGFENLENDKVGLHQPFMMGIPQSGSGTSGPMILPSSWRVDNLDPDTPDINTGFVIKEMSRKGFSNTLDSPYFINDNGILVFDRTSYK